MKILIVDDHVLFREGLVSLLNSQPDFTIVGEADTAREAIAKTIDLEPELVLLEIHLQNGEGVEAIKTIFTTMPETKIVVLTNHYSEELLCAAIRNGAVGYLLKKLPLSKLVLSLRALEKGEVALSRMMVSRLVHEFQRIGKTKLYYDIDLDILTPRELEVLRFLSGNASNQEIADCLTIAENTVKVHVHNILEKLSFQNRYQAGRFARRHGITSPNNGALST